MYKRVLSYLLVGIMTIGFTMCALWISVAMFMIDKSTLWGITTSFTYSTVWIGCLTLALLMHIYEDDLT